MMKSISEKTYLPISLVIIFSGVVGWVVTVGNQTTATADILKSYIHSLEKIDQRLSRIEGKLGLMGGRDDGR